MRYDPKDYPEYLRMCARFDVRDGLEENAATKRKIAEHLETLTKENERLKSEEAVMAIVDEIIQSYEDCPARYRESRLSTNSLQHERLSNETVGTIAGNCIEAPHKFSRRRCTYQSLPHHRRSRAVRGGGEAI